MWCPHQRRFQLHILAKEKNIYIHFYFLNKYLNLPVEATHPLPLLIFWRLAFAACLGYNLSNLVQHY
jgi:hypothetical protein